LITVVDPQENAQKNEARIERKGDASPQISEGEESEHASDSGDSLDKQGFKNVPRKRE